MDFKGVFNDLGVVFVTADRGEGKTSFAYYLLDQIKDKTNCYIFKHPKPGLVTKLGFKILYSIDELEQLNDICLWIDEPQILFPKYEKRGSIILNKLLSLVRQKDILLILSTSDTRYITASEEFYINTYIIKQIDYKMVKRGSKIRSIIREIAIITPEGYADTIQKNEFIFYNRKLKELIGKHNFKMPDYFNEELSKPFKSIPKLTS